MGLTDYHTKYFAYELTKRCSLDSLEKLAGQKQIKALESQRNGKRRALFDAQDEVDQRCEQLIGDIGGGLERGRISTRHYPGIAQTATLVGAAQPDHRGHVLPHRLNREMGARHEPGSRDVPGDRYSTAYLRADRSGGGGHISGECGQYTTGSGTKSALSGTKSGLSHYSSPLPRRKNSA